MSSSTLQSRPASRSDRTFSSSLSLSHPANLAAVQGDLPRRRDARCERESETESEYRESFFLCAFSVFYTATPRRYFPLCHLYFPGHVEAIGCRLVGSNSNGRSVESNLTHLTRIPGGSWSASGAESPSRHDTRAHTLTYTHTYAPHGLSCRRGVKHGHDQRTPSSQNHLVDTHTPHRLAPPAVPAHTHRHLPSKMLATTQQQASCSDLQAGLATPPRTSRAGVGARKASMPSSGPCTDIMAQHKSTRLAHAEPVCAASRRGAVGNGNSIDNGVSGRVGSDDRHD